MNTSVNSHNKLRSCIVGKAYPPEFFKWVTDISTREHLEKIAIETEEDFQLLIEILESFGVEVLRPEIPHSTILHNIKSNTYLFPPINPGEEIGVINDTCYIKQSTINSLYQSIRKEDWPSNMETFLELENLSKQYPILNNTNFTYCIPSIKNNNIFYNNLINLIKSDFILKVHEWIGYNFAQTNFALNNGQLILGSTIGINNNIKQINKIIPNNTKLFNVDAERSNVYFSVMAPDIILSGFDYINIDKLFTKNININYIPAPLHTPQSNIFSKVPEINHWHSSNETLNNNIDVLNINNSNIITLSNNRVLTQLGKQHDINIHEIAFRHSDTWNTGLRSLTVDLKRE